MLQVLEENRRVCVWERGREMCYESNKVVNVCLKRGYSAIYIYVLAKAWECCTEKKQEK